MSGPRPFSESPQSPSAPQDLMQVTSATIHEANTTKETRLRAHWQKAYTNRHDLQLQHLLTQSTGSRMSAFTSPAAGVTLPSSAVAVRVQGGWSPTTDMSSSRLLGNVQRAALDSHPILNGQYCATGQSVRPGFAHLPLMNHPRRRMPQYYGATLHTSIASGFDPRSY